MILQLLCVLIICVVVCIAQNRQIQEKWHRTEFRSLNPMIENVRCGRYRKSSICDPNNILTIDEADQIDDLISRVANTTECPCSHNACSEDNRGYRIAVALVPHMKWDMDQMGKERPTDPKVILNNNLHEAKLFAYDLLSKWNVGHCNEEVIIFYSLYDNVMYTMTGSVAAKKLTPHHIGEISLLVRKYFNPGGNIFEGLRSLITEYKRVFDGNYRPMEVERATPASPQAVVGGGASTIKGIYMMGAITIFTLLLFC